MLLVFSVAVIPSILFGARFYKKLGQTGAQTFEDRTAVQYLSTKLRQSDTRNVSIEDFGGVNALVITEDIDGMTYATRIYCHDGWLMELFALASGEFEPIDGEKLMPLSLLEAECENGLFAITLTYENGNERQMFISGRTAQKSEEGSYEE